jgi:hypothetical protein
MLTITKTGFEQNDDYTSTFYGVEGAVTLAGDSLWSDTAGRVVNVEGITVTEEQYGEEADDKYMHVTVTHDSTWDIYTDTAFAVAISEALGMDIDFTEQGMQDDGHASMEVYS